VSPWLASTLNLLAGATGPASVHRGKSKRGPGGPRCTVDDGCMFSVRRIGQRAALEKIEACMRAKTRVGKRSSGC